MNRTLNYYNANAEAFFDNTANVKFTDTQDKFLSKLKKNACILDFGCGSGRDTKYFIEQGYIVDPMDGSIEMCKLAKKNTGIPVEHKMFQDLNAKEKYDGIWACSSILHLQKEELKDVMKKMTCALKDEGIIYTSFKYGDFSGERKGRFFTDMTEDSFSLFIKDIPNLNVEELWITGDVRPGRGDEKWLNLILRKHEH